MDNESIDIKHIISILLAKIKLIVSCAIFFAIIAYIYSTNFITPLYKADVSVYVNSKKNISTNVDEASQKDIQTSQELVPTYISIANSRSSIKRVIDILEVDYSIDQVKNMITTLIEKDTGIFKIYVKNSSATEAALIADTIANVVADEMPKYVEGTAAKVIDYALVPVSPFSPNINRNTMLGFLVGLFLSSAAVLLLEFFDVRIKTEDDLTATANFPILGIIPVLDNDNNISEYSYSNTTIKGETV